MDVMRFGTNRSSVFFKCLALLASATLIIAAVLSVLNIRTLNGAVDDGIRLLGQETTKVAAASNAAALRFGNAEAIEESLTFILENSNGAALMGAGFNAQGELLISAGATNDPEMLASLETAALQALASGEAVVSDDGFSVVVPSFAGAEATEPSGVIAVQWTPAVSRAAARNQQYVSLAISGTVFVLLLFGAGILLKVMISQPIAVLADEIVTLRKGKYDVSVPHTARHDEIGTIARNLTDLQEQLADAAQGAEDRARIEHEQKHVVETLTVALQTLASGDLTQRVEEAFAPDYEPLRQNLNETVDTFVQVIEQVSRNAQTIRESANGIAQSSDDLSARTENQAASLEETAAALNMITTNVETSAKSAQDVEQIVVEARARAEQSSSVVQQTVDAMSRIEESSKRIGQITTVIDEIAFQTNLLALNAGVEAARAGEAGRGFSVVANEVRALAQRSSEAANEIKDLISDSSGHVEHGVQLVGSAGGELNAITSSVSTISTHVEGISKGAREQSSSLAEVNTGVSQLDRVTQQNAAMVAQANEAGRTLKAEATAMAESIATFKLPCTGGSSASAWERLAG